MKDYLTIKNGAFGVSAICLSVGLLGLTGAPWASLVAVGVVIYTATVFLPIMDAISE